LGFINWPALLPGVAYQSRLNENELEFRAVKKRVFVSVAIVAICALAALLLARRASSSLYYYHGKSLADWSVQAQLGNDEAKVALKSMGRAAVPGLIRLLHAREPWLKAQFLLLYNRLPARLTARLFGKLTMPDYRRIRWSAAEGLGTLGPDAKSAIPALGRLLSDTDQTFGLIAAQSLAKIGAGSGPELAAAVKDASPRMRETVVLALGKTGPEAQSAAVALAEMLNDTNFNVRNSASNGLQRLGSLAVPALAPIIEHGTPEARSVATQLLLQANMSIWAAARPLAKMAQADDPVSRQQAIEVLGAMRALNPVPFRALTNALNDPVPEVRLAAVKALRSYTTFTTYTRRAMESLPRCLHDDSPKVREEAARTLGYMGPNAETVISELNALLEDREEAVRNAAKEALARIQPASTPKQQNP
jgi:HEAT repeat protein